MKKQRYNQDLRDLEIILQERIYEEALTSLYIFFKAAWEHYEGSEFVDNWHIGCIAEHLQEFLKKKSQIGNRLLINIPPRSSKTLLATIASTGWQWLQVPSWKVIHVTHTEKLYVRNIETLRRLIKSPWFINRWCNESDLAHYKFSISKTQDTKTWMMLNEGGEFYGTSVGSSNIYGSGADCLIIDDPVDGSKANSPLYLEAANRLYSTTLKTRLNDKRNGKILVIQQRLNENDLSGYILENEPEYFHLNIPCLYSKRKTFISPIGFNDPRKHEGEVLDPIRFPPEFLATEKKNVTYFSCQYQQDPLPAEGNLLKADYIKLYEQLPSKFDIVYSIWDFSFDDTPDSSYTAGVVIGKTDNTYYILDLYKERADINRQLNMVRESYNDHRDISACIIEAKANGSAVNKMLQREIENIILIDPRNYGGSKENRFNATLPIYISNRVFLPINKPFFQDMMKDLIGFPRIKDNDVVDVITYGLLWGEDNTGLGEWYSGQQTGTNYDQYFIKEKKSIEEKRILYNEVCSTNNYSRSAARNLFL